MKSVKSLNEKVLLNLLYERLMAIGSQNKQRERELDIAIAEHHRMMAREALKDKTA